MIRILLELVRFCWKVVLYKALILATEHGPFMETRKNSAQAKFAFTNQTTKSSYGIVCVIFRHHLESNLGDHIIQKVVLLLENNND